jgi:hypothetical protein
MRQGPHHGAQKSTTTGNGDCATSASNVAASGTSNGSPGSDSVVWHLPQRASAASRENAMRLRWPQTGHVMMTPVLSSWAAVLCSA